MVNLATLEPAVNYPLGHPIHIFEGVTLRLRVKANCFTQERAKNGVCPFRPGRAVSLPSRA